MRILPFLLVLLATGATAQQWYGSAALCAGNGPDLGASYASVEVGRTFGAGMLGAAVGRDLAATEHHGLYFAELRGTYTFSLFARGPQPYVCGGLGLYLDGRWVNEYGAGLSWPNGMAVGACAFGGSGFLALSYTLLP